MNNMSAYCPFTRSVLIRGKKHLVYYIGDHEWHKNQLKIVVPWVIVLRLDIHLYNEISDILIQFKNLLIFRTADSPILFTELTSSSSTLLEICPYSNTSHETAGSHRLYCNTVIY